MNRQQITLNLIYTIAFMLLGIMGFWIYQQEMKHAQHIFTPTQDADAFGRDVISLQLNPAGQPDSILKTPYIVHYPKNDMSNIEKPNITLYINNKTPWHINARYAQNRENSRCVEFWHQVTISRAAGEHNTDFLLETNDMWYRPQEKLLMNRAPIMIAQQDNITRALGMDIDLAKENVRLQQQVQSDFAAR